MSEHFETIEQNIGVEQGGERKRRAVSDRRSNIDRRSLGLGAAGLNAKKGIERLGGNEDFYIEVLRSYAMNTPALLENLKNVEEDKLAYYAGVARGIEASSRGICADEFADIAETMERAASDGNIDYVKKHTPSFLAAAWKLVEEIDEMLTNISNGLPKPKKEKPDPVTLDRLVKACENYDMDGVDAAVTELECYEYETENELVLWLRESAGAMNFTQIIEILTEYS